MAIKRMSDQNCLNPIRSGRNNINRRTRYFGQSPQIQTCRLRQIVPARDPGSWLRPAGHFFVNRLATSDRIGAKRQDVGFDTVETIANTQFDPVHAIKHIQLSDAQAVNTADLN